MKTISPIDHLRFRFASTRARREAIQNAGFIALLLLAFGIVGRMDYEEELRQEAEAALDKAALHQAALVTCLNGGAPGLYTMDDHGVRHYIVCSGETFTVSDEGIRKL